jgi:DNA-binding response OmpR family regulator
LLIAEDEYLLATDLTKYFQKLGANVLGPVGNVEAARQFAGEADAAILDIDLNGEAVFPVADELADRGVPFVFFSGRGDLVLPARFRYASFLSKPLAWDEVAKVLFGEGRSEGEEAGEEVLDMLPRLRLSARLMLGDTAAADRLVEITLETAILKAASRPADVPLDLWLAELLEDVSRSLGPSAMN